MKIFGVAGWSGSGKTTLLLKLLPHLVEKGLKVATVKHTHHNPDVGDEITKALVAAGVHQVVTGSESRFALFHEVRGDEPALSDLMGRFQGMDLLLIEGFKFNDHPKIEVYDPSLDKPLLHTDHKDIVALASAMPIQAKVPQFSRDDVGEIADFILDYVGLKI